MLPLAIHDPLPLCCPRCNPWGEGLNSYMNYSSFAQMLGLSVYSLNLALLFATGQAGRQAGKQTSSSWPGSPPSPGCARQYLSHHCKYHKPHAFVWASPVPLPLVYCPPLITLLTKQPNILGGRYRLSAADRLCVASYTITPSRFIDAPSEAESSSLRQLAVAQHRWCFVGRRVCMYSWAVCRPFRPFVDYEANASRKLLLAK